jgi:hypothetical protein
MPKRLIDGEALWRSNKMLKVKHEYRGEYANIIPLAEADGTFQADARKVWAEVYSYNRSSWSIDLVEDMLQSFEDAGMLVRKQDEKGITWGRFVGIETRLPPESHRERYKQGNTNIFNNVANVRIQSGLTPDKGEGFGIGLGLDKDRIGFGFGSFKNIAIHYSAAFGISHSHNKKHIDKYSLACNMYGEERVLDLFDRWSKSADVSWLRDKKDNNGLNLFWRPLEEMAAGEDLARERNKPVEKKEIKTVDNLKYELPEPELSPELQEANRYKI